jgi:hypothetical protein
MGDGFVNETRYDTSIGYPKGHEGYQKDRNRMEDQYRWKIGIDGGIDGRSVAMEDRERWKIGSDGRSVSMAVSMEDRYRWRYRWKIGIDGRSVSMAVSMEDR